MIPCYLESKVTRMLDQCNENLKQPTELGKTLTELDEVEQLVEQLRQCASARIRLLAMIHQKRIENMRGRIGDLGNTLQMKRKRYVRMRDRIIVFSTLAAAFIAGILYSYEFRRLLTEHGQAEEELQQSLQ